ncbi:uncharacterized protein LOC121809097 [Salvia splendens]|uniref:uncharacterized protein LOC121809097 n=1 Tax=Salvia splendens TaxID=180675 RepID=UPI001C27D38D|nr:uncharacterized protein LOC121809097 [Salvia splendens]
MLAVDVDYRTTSASIRELAYGGAYNMFDECIHFADTTGRECLKYFNKGIIESFGPIHLRKPTPSDCHDLLDLHGRVHGFPGMLGSTLGLEELSDYFERPINDWVKGKHPTIILKNRIESTINFEGNDNQHSKVYYLANGIYSRCPAFMKMIKCPTGLKRAYFAQRQKDVQLRKRLCKTMWNNHCAPSTMGSGQGLDAFVLHRGGR